MRFTPLDKAKIEV